MAGSPLPDSSPSRATVAPVPIEARTHAYAGLAGLAFASVERPAAGAVQHTMARHLAFLPSEALDLDLSNPEQRDFGDYELLEKLGQGGMGVVYRAHQKSLDREVALKLLAAGPWASADFIARFRREAQSAARMQHPNIVPIYEIGAHDELNFFSMMLVRGESLAARLHREGPFTARGAATLLRTVAEAVDYAHRLGVLHLDLKPGNVLLDERGEAQVADFGLARRIDDTLGADNDEVSGTPSYMAPEQATLKTHKLSPATDVYGLGAILYELLTGRPPFLAASPQETLKRVVASTPERPGALRADVPIDLDAICLKCLEKDPRERYSSARALADDLGRYIDGRAVSVRPLNAIQRAMRWARREPRVAAAAAAFVFALVSGLVATAMQWQRADANAARANDTAWAQRREAIWRAFDERRWFDALPLLVANIREQEAQGANAAAALDRRRLGTLLAASPVLVDVVRIEDDTSNPMHGGVMALALNPAADTVVATLLHGKVAAIDVASGRLRWARDAGLSRTENWLRISADGRFFDAEVCKGLSLLGFCNTRFDMATGEPQPEPEGFDRLDGAMYSPDGRYAVLISDRREHQLWQTDPWRPLSDRRADDGKNDVDLVANDGTLLQIDNDGRAVVIDGPSGRAMLALNAGLEETYQNGVAAADRAGRHFALTTSFGSVDLVDHRVLKRLRLPNACQEPMTTVAFSSDDLWVAAGCRDGTVRVWDVATGNLVAAPISHPPVVDWIDAHAASRLMRVSAGSRHFLWRLPERASPLAKAVPATPMQGAGSDTNPTAITFDAGTGLMAVGGNNGLVKLWRLSASPMLPGSAPPIHTGNLRFDGRHVVVTDGAVATVIDVHKGAAMSIPLAHPQPVSQAILVADNAVLVAASGPALHFWDWRGGKPVREPVALPASPAWLDADIGGQHLLVGWHAIRNGQPQVVLRVLRAVDGGTEAEASVESGISDLRIEGDERVLIRRHREVEVLRLGDLARAHPNRAWPGEDGTPMLLTDARIGGDVLWMTTKVVGASLATTRSYATLRLPRLLRWPATDVAPQVGDATGFNQRLAALGNGDLALAAELPIVGVRQLWQANGGRIESLVRPSDGENRFALAFNAEGTLLARGLADGVIVTDAASGEPLSPPLRAALDAQDVVTQIAFASDSNSLLARTAAGRWLHWAIAPDLRPLERIVRHVTQLASPESVLYFEQAPPLAPALRLELRALDPGPIDLRRLSSAFDPNLQVLDGFASSDLRFVDLSPWFTTIAARVDQFPRTGLDMRSIPLGLQRLDDVDFLIRGRVQMGRAAALAEVPHGTLHAELERIALPAKLGRLQLLLGDFRSRYHEGPVLTAILHYRDGGELRRALAFPQPSSRLLHYGEPFTDLVAAAAAGAHLAWVGDGIDTAAQLMPVIPIYRLTVANPEPARAVESVSLVAHSHPVLLAITAEPPINDEDTAVAR